MKQIVEHLLYAPPPSTPDRAQRRKKIFQYPRAVGIPARVIYSERLVTEIVFLIYIYLFFPRHSKRTDFPMHVHHENLKNVIVSQINRNDHLPKKKKIEKLFIFLRNVCSVLPTICCQFVNRSIFPICQFFFIMSLNSINNI